MGGRCIDVGAECRGVGGGVVERRGGVMVMRGAGWIRGEGQNAGWQGKLGEEGKDHRKDGQGRGVSHAVQGRCFGRCWGLGGSGMQDVNVNLPSDALYVFWQVERCCMLLLTACY